MLRCLRTSQGQYKGGRKGDGCGLDAKTVKGTVAGYLRSREVCPSEGSDVEPASKLVRIPGGGLPIKSCYDLRAGGRDGGDWSKPVTR